MFLSPSFLLLLLSSTTSAFPNYQNDRSLEETASCPMIQAGPKMEEALSQAATRREAWEAAYPSTSFERKYTPGLKSDGEIFCDGNEEHEFCNKIHGPWGDSIPQDEGVYCLWAILEFQDPPDFGWGTGNDNETIFNGIFGSSLISAVVDVPSGAVLIAGSHSGLPSTVDPEAIPWPVSSIIWRSGNKYAKDWIELFHRPSAQIPGYNFGFTLHSHYKAVECETIIPTLEANGFVSNTTGWSDSNTTDFDEYGPVLVLKDGNFRKFWNAFSDMEDLSPQFVEDECVSECSIGPCPDAEPESTTVEESSAGPASFLNRVSIVCFGLLFVGIAGLL